MKKILVAFTCTAALSLMGCIATTGEKQTLGTVIGAVAGGVARAQVGKGNGQLIATGAGVLLGALIGNEVGATRKNSRHRNFSITGFTVRNDKVDRLYPRNGFAQRTSRQQFSTAEAAFTINNQEFYPAREVSIL